MTECPLVPDATIIGGVPTSATLSPVFEFVRPVTTAVGGWLREVAYQNCLTATSAQSSSLFFAPCNATDQRQLFHYEWDNSKLLRSASLSVCLAYPRIPRLPRAVTATSCTNTSTSIYLRFDIAFHREYLPAFPGIHAVYNIMCCT